MSFGDAIGECFFNYANFRDRAARAEYWWWALFATVVYSVALLLDFFIFNSFGASPFFLVVYLAFLLPGLSVTVRRLHDTGRSGWWLLIPVGLSILVSAVVIAGVVAYGNEQPSTGLLMVIGLLVILLFASTILLLVWMLLPGAPANNAYGPNRYAGA
jgi:uncharacterized membrane protein YhaH (DUF805 family)